MGVFQVCLVLFVLLSLVTSLDLWICSVSLLILHSSLCVCLLFVSLLSYVSSFNSRESKDLDDIRRVWNIQVRSIQNKWHLPPHQLRYVNRLQQMGNYFSYVTVPLVVEQFIRAQTLFSFHCLCMKRPNHCLHYNHKYLSLLLISSSHLFRVWHETCLQ